jgi:(p)ppGpp synthase/HD superfamily hydrolase
MHEMALGARFDTALVFAAAHHREQVRKGSDTPYVGHLLGVASIAIEHGATEDEAIGALLHDVIEDQGVKKAELEKLFGTAVAAIVDGCSDTDQIPKPPWKERKERYIKHVSAASASVRFVSMCDKLHNARSILADLRALGDGVWARFTGGREGSLWYYRALIDAYRGAGTTKQALLDELDRTVSEIERLA